MDAFRLSLSHPGALACALVALCAVAATLRLRGSSRAASIWIAPAWALTGVVVAGLLLSANSVAAHAVLVVLAILAGGAATLEAYRGLAGQRLSAARAVLCGLLRTAALCGLLVIVARPNWSMTVSEWEKPLLVALLDQSASMGLVDPGVRTTGGLPTALGPELSAAGPTRAARVNAALQSARRAIEDLAGLYELQVRSIGGVSRALPDWRIEPAEPTTALAGALRSALGARSEIGEAPVVVLVVGDGGENAADPRAVLAAAGELGGQRVALLSIGVGPDEATTPGVLLAPLDVPAEVGARDRLVVRVQAEVVACAGHELGVRLTWNEGEGQARTVGVSAARETLDVAFETQPPAPGLHRLTARVRLPPSLGGAVYQQTAVVAVRDDQIRVLLLDGRPRPEFAFIGRVLRADERFAVEPRLLAGAEAAREGDPDWARYDAVLLGDVARERLGDAALEALRRAVTESGVGLLLQGGGSFFNSGTFARTPLDAVLPIELTLRRVADEESAAFTPTDAGRRHPALEGWMSNAAAPPGGGAAEPDAELAPVAIAARFGDPRPLATVLAADGEGRPLLVVQEVGRGRSAAAAWAQTWPWALASEAGRRRHEQFWRQMTVWLANRRPSAWVLSDAASYPERTVLDGQRLIAIRAGVSGVTAGRELNPTLRLTRSTGQAGDPAAQPGRAGTEPAGQVEVLGEIPLRRDGAEWRAELPTDLPGTRLTAGRYGLELKVALPASAEPGGPPAEVLTAGSAFWIERINAETQPPTANLALLRAASERTATVGGRYAELRELPELLERLAETDRRRRVDRLVRFEPIADRPWVMWFWVVAALAAEWTLRKQGGLA